MQFQNRAEAGELLARELAKWRGSHPLVVAIPRGAVPMARIIAERLDGDLDVVLSRKLGAPGNPEFAIGAVDETGWTYLSDYAQASGASASYLEREVAAQLETMRQRRALYTPARAAFDPTGRVVIVVDDGLATGATMFTALHAMRDKGARHLVCAVPVASPDAIETVRPLADEVVCLHAPMGFFAISEFYRSFSQVNDDEVVAILRGAPRPGPAASFPPT